MIRHPRELAIALAALADQLAKNAPADLAPKCSSFAAELRMAYPTVAVGPTDPIDPGKKAVPLVDHLVDLLSEHVGETGEIEGAVDVLKRVLVSHRAARALLHQNKR